MELTEKQLEFMLSCVVDIGHYNTKILSWLMRQLDGRSLSSDDILRPLFDDMTKQNERISNLRMLIFKECLGIKEQE